SSITSLGARPISRISNGCATHVTTRKRTRASCRYPRKSGKRRCSSGRTYSSACGHPRPRRPSDDPATWKHVSLAIRKERKRILRERDKRRLGKHCPVCLAELSRTSLQDL